MADETAGGIKATVGFQDDTEAGVAKLRASLAAVERELQELHGAFGQTGAAAALTGERIGQLAQRKVELKGRIDAVTSSLQRQAVATTQLNAGMAGISGGAGRSAMGLMMLGQTVDDLQYGFSAVVNNIPGVLMSFGVGAGLAGAAAIAGVGVNQLVNHWGQLQEALGTGIPVPALEGLEKLNERLGEVDKRLKELRGKKRLDLSETMEFGELTGERARLKDEATATRETEALTRGRPKGERERGAAFVEAINETGGKDALQELVDALKGQANAKGIVAPPGAEAGAPGKVAEELFRNAAKGDETARASIVDALELRAGRFGGSALANRIRTMSPEARASEAETPAILAANKKDAAERQKEFERTLQVEQNIGVAAHDREMAARKEVRDSAREARARADRRAMEDMPGLRDAAEREYMGLMMGTGMDPKRSRAELERRIAREMEAANISPEGAMMRAREMAGETARGVNEDLMRGRLNPQLRQSQLMDISQVNAGFQQAISNDNPLLQTSRSMLDRLTNMDRNIENLRGMNIRRAL